MKTRPLVSFSDPRLPFTGEQGKIAIFGSTGSIGESTLKVIRRLAPMYRVEVLCAGTRAEKLFDQVREFEPRFVGVGDEVCAATLAKLCENNSVPCPEIAVGNRGLSQLASEADYDVMVSAILGIAGLEANLIALSRNKRLALANKESLVVAGHLFEEFRAANPELGEIIPVDSEHSALFQLLAQLPQREQAKLYLTASGGPFLRRPIAELEAVTPDQAAAHPRWKMGRKISIDSATMMNKAFELYEAYWLFGNDESDIEVVVHPESVVHGMVEDAAGCLFMHAASPDMALPIQLALMYPELGGRALPSVMASGFKNRNLCFEELDLERFPAVSLARQCLRGTGNEGLVFHTANEVAVGQFEGGLLPFNKLVVAVENALARFSGSRASSVAELLEQERTIRQRIGADGTGVGAAD